MDTIIQLGMTEEEVTEKVNEYATRLHHFVFEQMGKQEYVNAAEMYLWAKTCMIWGEVMHAKVDSQIDSGEAMRIQ